MAPVTVWVFVVSTFLAANGALTSQQPGLLGQARQKQLARFVLPTAAACEAARNGVREFAETAGKTLVIGNCTEEAP